MNTKGICPDCGRSVNIRDGKREQHVRPDTGEGCHYPPTVQPEDVVSVPDPGPFVIVGVELAPIQVDLTVNVTGDGTQAVEEFVTGLERWIQANPGKLTSVKVKKG